MDTESRVITGAAKMRKRSRMPSVDSDEHYLERNLIGGGFRRPRKGLINLNSVDDLARM